MPSFACFLHALFQVRLCCRPSSPPAFCELSTSEVDFFLLLFINFKMISSLFGVLLLVLRLDPMKLRLTSNMVCRQEPALNFQAAVILITF